MSATGQGGVTIISGTNHSTLTPIVIPAVSQLLFRHGANRRAFSVLVTSGADATYGQVLTGAEGVTISQPQVLGRYDDILVTNTDPVDSITVFVSCRWEEPTPELDLVRAGDSRISVGPLPLV